MEREVWVKRREIGGPQDGTLREGSAQVLRQCLGTSRISRKSQGQRSSILHIPACRKPQRRFSPLMGPTFISEEGFPQGCLGFVARRGLLLFRSLGRSHGQAVKLPSLPQPAGIGGGIGLFGQPALFHDQPARWP